MSPINLEAWVAQEDVPSRQLFRKAVHLVLKAIAQSPDLSPMMIMKGGILLAIGYQSTRFTTDIDFSTSHSCNENARRQLIEKLSLAIDGIDSDNEYGLALKLQSHTLKPPINPLTRPELSFPTLQIRIGYALRGQLAQRQKLATNQTSQTVQIDYSFNEWASGIEHLRLEKGNLSVYGLHDLVAEKLRSVLQQPIRKRARFQDIYDLHLLIQQAAFTSDDKALILEKFLIACNGRVPDVRADLMRNETLIDPEVLILNISILPLYRDNGKHRYEKALARGEA